MSLQIATVKDKTWHQWPWPTYKQHQPIIWRLQQLHVAIRHSNCLLGKWTRPHSAACQRLWSSTAAVFKLLWLRTPIHLRH